MCIRDRNEISLTYKESGLTGGFHSESEKVYELIKGLPPDKLPLNEMIEKITDKMEQ